MIILKGKVNSKSPSKESNTESSESMLKTHMQAIQVSNNSKENVV